MRPAIFFDRDGTLNQEVGYAGRPEDFHIFPFAAEAVRRARAAGFAAVVVTNQAGVARGYYQESAIAVLHALLRDHLTAAGTALDGIYYCPHHPNGTVAPYAGVCVCRKPGPGMLHQAAADLALDLARSWVIGDRDVDVDLAHAVGARAVLIRTGYGVTTEANLGLPDRVTAAPPEHIADNALAAVDWIAQCP